MVRSLVCNCSCGWTGRPSRPDVPGGFREGRNFFCGPHHLCALLYRQVCACEASGGLTFRGLSGGARGSLGGFNLRRVFVVRAVLPVVAALSLVQVVQAPAAMAAPDAPTFSSSVY